MKCPERPLGGVENDPPHPTPQRVAVREGCSSDFGLGREEDISAPD